MRVHVAPALGMEKMAKGAVEQETLESAYGSCWGKSERKQILRSEVGGGDGMRGSRRRIEMEQGWKRRYYA